MDEFLKNIGFKDIEYGWMVYESVHFNLQISADRSYFFIYTENSGDREAAPYPFLSDDKLKNIIQAHEEYFK